jgi:hypothetical protein
MTLARAWMRKAESDLRTAQLLDERNDANARCQAISKYQQCVEKSIKGVLDNLFAARLVIQGSDRSHRVPRYASVLVGFPATPDTRALLSQLRLLFSDRVLEQINLLDSFVPAYPARGTHAARNDEYPFQDVAGDWHSPSDADAFTAGEVKRIRRCSGLLVRRLGLILGALDVLYP